MSSQSQYASIITAKEIAVVRHYITLSSQLRADYNRMKGSPALTSLSKQCGLSAVLDEQGVNKLIDAVSNHTSQWAGIELKMRKLCAEVFTYSDQFTATSNLVVGQIKSLPGYSDASSQLSALPEEAWEGVVIPLGEVYFTIVPSIKVAIGEASEDLGRLAVTVAGLKDVIFNFKVELMNSIQTELRKITKLDTVHELEETLSRVNMNEDDRLVVRGHMHNVTSAFADVVAQSYIREMKTPSAALINYYKSDYEKILQGLPSASADILRELVLKMSSDAVLTQHFSAFHDAVERLVLPLERADKGVGQLRTLFTDTVDVMQSAQARIQQVTPFAQIKRIEKSLISAAAQWLSARSNAEELDKLLAAP